MFLNLGVSREDFALSLLEKFKNKLHNAIQSNQGKKPEEIEEDNDDDWYVFISCKEVFLIINAMLKYL